MNDAFAISRTETIRVASDNDCLTPFPIGDPSVERRKTICVVQLPFRPRRTSDYIWLGKLSTTSSPISLWRPILLSSILHAAVLFFLGHFFSRFLTPHIDPIEVDFAAPSEVMPASLARRSSFARKEHPESKKTTLKGTSQLPTQSETRTTSAAETKIPAPHQSLAGTQQGGEVALLSLTAFPKLLNRQDLSANLRRFYPEAERRASHEASVVLDLLLNSEGEVTQVDIVRSSAEGFNLAAIEVAKLCRFSPARIDNRSVPVRLRQTISFRLEN